MRKLLSLMALLNALVAALLPQFWLHGEAQGSPAATVVRATAPVRVDGLLDEADWAAASVAGEILQREPNPGQPATERTEVKLLHDDQNLYIGVYLL